MTLDKIQWKLFFSDSKGIKPADFFRVFNAWIPESPEVFVDVADYSHVSDGPLVVLVGHFVDYALDATDRELGFLYSRRQPLEGPLSDRLRATLKALLQAALCIEGDPLFQGKLHFRTDRLGFCANDRAAAPNTPQTLDLFKPEFLKLARDLYGDDKIDFRAEPNPKRRFSAARMVDEYLALYARLVARA